jgi:hypothetical protein
MVYYLLIRKLFYLYLTILGLLPSLNSPSSNSYSVDQLFLIHIFVEKILL